MPAWQPVYKLIALREEWLWGLLSAVSSKSAFKTPLSIGEKTQLPSSGLEGLDEREERGMGIVWSLVSPLSRCLTSSDGLSFESGQRSFTRVVTTTVGRRGKHGM